MKSNKEKVAESSYWPKLLGPFHWTGLLYQCKLALSVVTLLVTFSERWLRNALSYTSQFLLYFSLITLLSHCVKVYFLILVITEWVSINKKAIFSQQTSLKTNNYVLPEWNGSCRRRDWLLQYYFQVSVFSFKTLFCL